MKEIKTKYLDKLVRAALKEDIGTGDVTTGFLFPDNPRLTARLFAKSDGIVCGRSVFEAVFRTLSPSVSFRWSVKDGDRVKTGAQAAAVTGPVQALLAGERTALNFIQHLSGIATLTAQFVRETGGRVAILDTRKTMPLLRPLEKYAVHTGGGKNHRFGLSDMVLIKDNHIAGYMKIHGCNRLTGVKQTTLLAKRGARQRRLMVETEVENLAEAKAAYEAGADVIMFDNTTAAEVRSFARYARTRKRKIIVEWSGGVTLKGLRALRTLPADWISVGALTHSAPALDFSLKI